MKKSLIMLSILCMFSCASNDYYDNNSDGSKETASGSASSPTETHSPAKTFFVLTSWKTQNRQLAMQSIPVAQKQLMGLWKKGIVENVYYRQNGDIKNNEPLALVAFFIKAASEDDVRATLDTTVLVKNQLATYTLREVGKNVLGRNDNTSRLNSAVNIETFAVTWSMSNSFQTGHDR
ncbi:hypothetical protein [Dyadobacter sp. 676]|uniref:Lipoprotein n=1 Tax=Dyadobacter sp. 676 TaxID=3088362 RepID=A0AAU8FHM7_9BACT